MLSSPLSFSVVISTYNRADGLALTLRSLEQQTYPHLEVVVVIGPCTDHTQDVLARYAGKIKVASCPEANLSRSRNIGIDATSGECIAFIDDDAVARPNWIASLAASYTDDVQGVGGFVLDHTGRQYQYRYSACRRDGSTDFSIAEISSNLVTAGSETFLYLQGTNASFRRSALTTIGGFNEQIAYYHDETDVCCRIIDACGPLAMAPEGIVLHKYAPSHMRDANRVVHDPYHVVRSQVIFARQNGEGFYSSDFITERLQSFANGVRRGGDDNKRLGKLSDAAHHFYMAQVERGLVDGEALAEQDRPFRTLASVDTNAFIRFPTRFDRTSRLSMCFVSQEYPPGPMGGIGRFTNDLAKGFADRGHDVRVITSAGPHPSSIDYEDGVWVHRLAPIDGAISATSKPALIHNYELMARVYRELALIALEAPIDVVSAPLWNVEGALAHVDPRMPSVLTIMTSFKTVASFHPSWRDEYSATWMPTLEELAFRSAPHVHAISSAILQKAIEDYGAPRDARVVYLGVENHREKACRNRTDDRIRVLFVGRLEKRKGIDVFLAAAQLVLSRRHDVEFVLVGAVTKNTELGGRTYVEEFTAKAPPNVAARVRFTGAVNEEELQQHYADADIFCLPSRFESFGLVLLEASVFNVPLVAARCGGMTEIVEEGETGLLVAPDDPNELAEALERLAASPEMRRRLGDGARARLEDMFSLDVTVPKTIDFYRDVSLTRSDATPEAAISMVERHFAQLIQATSKLNAAEAATLAHKLLTEEKRLAPNVQTRFEGWLRRRLRKLRRSLRKIMERTSGSS